MNAQHAINLLWPKSTGCPDSSNMAAPNTGCGSLGPCLQDPVTLLQISTESSTLLTWPDLDNKNKFEENLTMTKSNFPYLESPTPPTTTTSTFPVGDNWVVQLWLVLA